MLGVVGLIMTIQAVDGAVYWSGLKVEVLSGDRIEVVGRTAYEFGVDRWQAEMSPVDKTAYLERLAREGRKVCIVGEGTNDRPALATAYVSMSLASAVDISQTAADNVFQGEGLSGVPLSLRIAARANRLVEHNFFGMAFSYNLLTVPLAVAGLVTPLNAAAAMSASSIVVELNVLRLGWRRREVFST